jgi:hypothetical protein
MRAYALVLGVLITAGSASFAQLAVRSAGFERLWQPSSDPVDPAQPNAVWYGGILDPVIVQAPRGTRQALAVKGLGRFEDVLACAASHAKDRTVIGPVM